MNPTTARFVFNASESPNNFIFNLVGDPNLTGGYPDFATGFDFASLVVDNENNIIAYGSALSGVSVGTNIICKTTDQGTLIYQKALADASLKNYNCVLDSSNNVYIAGTYVIGLTTSGYTKNAGCLFKLNSSGTVQFQKSISDNTAEVSGFAYEIFINSAAQDLNDNIYAVGYHYSPLPLGSLNAAIIKYNSQGVLQWQRTINSPSVSGGYPESEFRTATTDSSGNIYACGRIITNTPSGQPELHGYIAKYNTSGTLVWQRTLRNPNYQAECWGISTDNKNLVLYCSVGGAYELHLINFDVNGNFLWGRLVTQPATFTPSVTLNGVTPVIIPEDGSILWQVDARDNFDSLNRANALLKYSSGGVLQYQRQLALNSQAVSGSGWTLKYNSIALSKSRNNMYIVAGVSNTNNYYYTAGIMGLRTNGGNLGTFPYLTNNTSLIITTGSFVDSPTTLIPNTVTFTGLTPTFTTGTLSLFTGNMSGVPSKTPI